MDTIFIYYKNLKFAENKQFTLEFSDEDLLQEINLKSILSKYKMKFTQLKQYPTIEKISELANRIIKNGVDHGYDSAEIEISYLRKSYEIDILKFSHSKSINAFKFFLSLSDEKKICYYLLTLQKTV